MGQIKTINILLTTLLLLLLINGCYEIHLHNRFLSDLESSFCGTIPAGYFNNLAVEHCAGCYKVAVSVFGIFAIPFLNRMPLPHIPTLLTSSPLR